MATKQQSRSRSSSRSSSRSRAGSPRPPTKKRSAPARKAPPPGSTVSHAFREAFDGHGHDAWGLLLLVLGVVAGLGIYVDLAGPVGRALANGAEGAVGYAAYLVPPALVVLGLLLIRGPREGEPGVRSLRPIIGSAIVLVSVCGLLHIAGGRPQWGADLSEFATAGGVLGAGVAGPLEKVLAVWGAAFVLFGLGALGLVVATGTTVRHAAAGTADKVRPATTFVSRHVGRLFEVGDAAAGDEPEVELRDEAAPAVTVAGEPVPEVVAAGDDADEAPAPKKKRKKPATDVHVPDEAEEAEQLAIDLEATAQGSPWKLPPPKLLDRVEAAEVDRGVVEAQGRTLESALAEHGVETRLVGMVVGPTVTRFELELGPGVKVARVTSLNKDIAYAMASPDVRILAPIPGRQAIGVEVPNTQREVVALGDLLASPEAKRAQHPLEVAVGRDINGKAVMANLARMPHILIAGATGAGKSSCINSIITSILMRTTPDQVRLILVDPKRVELGQYNRLPHLLTQVVTNPKKAANALAWAVREMERRYDLLSEVGVRDIDGYNAAYDRGDYALGPEDDPETARTYERLPYILVVVDELNDLMMVAARDVEESICRIAQMARAVGIHLVIATQRPSVNVITGVIKANVPARLAFAVSSLADSRVILDQGGAERLVGKGDMLLLDQTSSVPSRIQGAWVTEKEVRNVVAHWRRLAPEVAFDDAAVQGTDDGGLPGGGGVAGGGDADDDDLLVQAMELVVRSQLGSTSMLQRKLKVGFARAGRIMDLLEQRGVVGPSTGSKARDVLMTEDELEEVLAGRS
ncbi:MAG: DNA translocase FtsK 4TM domain-containing protein [Acidimicrobiales bacterium]